MFYLGSLTLLFWTSQLMDKLREKHRLAKVMVHSDHAVVKTVDGEIVLYLLCEHSSGKCAAFIHT